MGGPVFLDAKGFRFHLPAYLHLLVHDTRREYFVGSSILFLLADVDEDDDRYALLDSAQCAAIAECLQFVWRHIFEEEDRETEPEVVAAITAWRDRTIQRRKPSGEESVPRPRAEAEPYDAGARLASLSRAAPEFVVLSSARAISGSRAMALVLPSITRMTASSPAALLVLSLAALAPAPDPVSTPDPSPSVALLEGTPRAVSFRQVRLVLHPCLSRPSIDEEICVSVADLVPSSLHTTRRDARIVPAFRDGRAYGVKVFIIRPSSWWAKVGLQSRDVVRSICGYPSSSPYEALHIYSELRDQRDIWYEIEREGKTMRVRVRIED